ncbi:hypothetical protein AAHC03_026213 [Spirometra sp. Aus1]
MKRALKARQGTFQSPPLRLYFRSLESEQAEELETSIVSSSIGSTSVNTSETTLPVPVTADTWSTSSLADPFPTEAFSGDTYNISYTDGAGTFNVSKPEQEGDANDDTLDSVSQMCNDVDGEHHSESERWTRLNEDVFEDEFLEMRELAFAYAFWMSFNTCKSKACCTFTCV